MKKTPSTNKFRGAADHADGARDIEVYKGGEQFAV